MKDSKWVLSDKPQTSRNGFAVYIVIWLIFSIARKLVTTSFEEIFVLVISMLCGLSYYPLKDKIKINSEAGKVVVTFLILEMIAGFLVGVVTTFI